MDESINLDWRAASARQPQIAYAVQASRHFVVEAFAKAGLKDPTPMFEAAARKGNLIGAVADSLQLISDSPSQYFDSGREADAAHAREILSYMRERAQAPS